MKVSALVRHRGVASLLSLFIAVFAFTHNVSFAGAAEAWPADAGSNIGGEMAGIFPAFESSGVAYHPGLDRLIAVSDEGEVCVMTTSGTDTACVDLGAYDLEAVTIANPASDLVYFAVEHPDSILEFNARTLALTGKSWNLTTWLTGADNLGIEALAFIPNGMHPYTDSSSGGLFYGSLQADGSIHVFDVNLSGSQVSQIDAVIPLAGYTDLADLSFNEDTEILYGVYDANNILVELDSDLNLIKSVALPGSDQEGIALIADCDAGLADFFVAWDTQPVVMAHSGYPVTCVDDPAPEYGPIEFSGNALDDDGDGIIDEENTLAENGAHPEFAGLDPNLASSYSTAIKSVTSGSAGTIVVTYTDNSVYRYIVYNSRYSTRVVRIIGTTYYKVRLSISNKYIKINALNGAVQ